MVSRARQVPDPRPRGRAFRRCDHGWRRSLRASQPGGAKFPPPRCARRWRHAVAQDRRAGQSLLDGAPPTRPGNPGCGGPMIHVRVERRNEGQIGVLTLARPEKKNALDRAMADAIVAGLAEFKSDRTIRVVLLAADGADFCAGADLTALSAMIDQGPDAHAADAE